MPTISFFLTITQESMRALQRVALDRAGENLVLFIHGLSGSAEGTWGDMLRSFASDEDLSRYAYDCYSYPTSLSRLPFTSRRSGVREISNGLLTHLKAHHSDKKNIVLVGHSLGGIIARQFLLDIAEELNSCPIKGLVLYAVPNTGSAVASLGKIVSWNHKHLFQLCKNSDLLENLNIEWVKRRVEEKVKTLYVVGGADKVVSRDSAACFIGADINTIIDRDHRSIIKPQNKSDTLYKVLKDFVIKTIPLGPISSANNVSEDVRINAKKGDPLFDIYTKDVEEFYIKRRSDTIVFEASIGAHVWVFGESGVGKTAALKRLGELSEWKLYHISLGSFQNATGLSLLTAICNELYDRIGMHSTVLPSNLPLFELLAHLRKIYTKLGPYNPVAILVEEIPLSPGEEYASFIEAINHVTMETGVDASLLRIIWLFSSIHEPNDDISTNLTKIRERIQFIKFLPWDTTEITRLVAKINREKGLRLSKEQKALIIDRSSGNPRIVKMILREMRNELGGKTPLPELIASVRSRLGKNV